MLMLSKETDDGDVIVPTSDRRTRLFVCKEDFGPLPPKSFKARSKGEPGNLNLRTRYRYAPP